MRHFCDIPGDHRHSNGEPVLRPSFYDETLSRGPIYVCGGLHYIKGNRRPYFSLTLSAEDCGGCMHDEIMKRFPELAPLAALHLSDDRGVPMYAEENGWYWFAGACYGFAERYHGGNSNPKKTPDECLAVWAKHVRVDWPRAVEIRSDIWRRSKHEAQATGYRVDDTIHALRAEGIAARRLHRYFIEAQAERWAIEAQECLAALGIDYYYGDRWPEAEGAA